jgi:ribonuclease HII
MFIVGAMFDDKDLKELSKMGVKDSKLLLHPKRIELAEKIIDIANEVKVIKVEPAEIDEAVGGKDGLNLNWLEALKQAEIINELKPNRVIIDCPSPNIKAYTEFLLNYIDDAIRDRIEFIIDHKADKNYVECSSASIIAKVERNKEIEELENTYGQIGPGYQSNPITQKFIKENWERHPEIFRKSWLTWQNHKKAKGQKKLDDFD